MAVSMGQRANTRMEMDLDWKSRVSTRPGDSTGAASTINPVLVVTRGRCRIKGDGGGHEYPYMHHRLLVAGGPVQVHCWRYEYYDCVEEYVRLSPLVDSA